MPGSARRSKLQRPNPREVLRSVLDQIEDLPEGFADRLESLVDLPHDERTDAIQQLIEESAS